MVPIIQQDTLWGLLIAHQCNKPRDWQIWEVELLQQLANQMAIAIQQSELYQQLEEELRERQSVEVALRENENLFRSLSESVPVGIIKADAQGEDYLYESLLSSNLWIYQGGSAREGLDRVCSHPRIDKLFCLNGMH